jgi:hypothetical protein
VNLNYIIFGFIKEDDQDLELNIYLMKYISLAILILGALTAGAKKETVEELLKQAKNYYHLSEDVEELK